MTVIIINTVVIITIIISIMILFINWYYCYPRHRHCIPLVVSEVVRRIE